MLVFHRGSEAELGAAAFCVCVCAHFVFLVLLSIWARNAALINSDTVICSRLAAALSRRANTSGIEMLTAVVFVLMFLPVAYPGK